MNNHLKRLILKKNAPIILLRNSEQTFFSHKRFHRNCTSLGQESAHQLFDNMSARNFKPLFRHYSVHRTLIGMSSINSTNIGGVTGSLHVQCVSLSYPSFFQKNAAKFSTLLGQKRADELLDNTAANSDRVMEAKHVHQCVSLSNPYFFQKNVAKYCTLLGQESANELLDNVNAANTNSDKHCNGEMVDELLDNVNAATNSDRGGMEKPKHSNGEMIDFTNIHINKLPTVLIMGRPNVGKSALFNRLIRRREALVYNTPTDHVTRDIREGVAKLGNLRFKVLDSAGIEAQASSGSVLSRTAEMTGNVLSKTQFALLLVDARDGVQPMDLDVGKWLRKNAPGMKTIVVMNKAESLDDCDGTLAAAAGEAYNLGFGDPIALSAETGFGMAELHETLRPLLEEYVLQNNLCDDEIQENDENDSSEDMECKLPLQLAIVGRPNVGKSTLLNTILQEDRVLVGPEAGLTRDSIRAEFEYEGRTVYLVDTAGWLERTKQQEKGPASLSIMQSRKHLMRAHVIVLVLDAEEIAKDRRSMKHVEVVIARRAVEEGRGLVVIVNKMDLLRGKENSKYYKSVIEAVPQEIQTVIPQVTGIPVVFVSALEGKSQIAVMNQVVETYEKWCLRLSTARLNRWLRKVMSRHSWKDQAAQPKIKYFTQVKARPPTFIAFMSGKTKLSDTDLRFLTRSLKEDFDLGGIPVRILQRTVEKNDRTKTSSKNKQSANRTIERVVSDKRTIHAGDLSCSDSSGDQLDEFGVSN